jgi:hypothetical protein
MTLREKIKWNGNTASRLKDVQESQVKITAGEAKEPTYYFFVGKTVFYAIEAYLDENKETSIGAAKLVIDATLLFFYGNWREKLPNRDGKTGQEEWKTECLWYDEVHRSLPFAAALSDWNAVKQIAEYPPDLQPSQAQSRGESAWGWALITFLRGESREKVEMFLKKAEGLEKAKRPKLLCPVLRALMNNDAGQFKKTLLAYLAYYRKSEFKLLLTKLVSLEGTTLYHLGRKQGFNVKLPENVADHIIRFE